MLLIIFSIIYFNPFSNTEIIIIEHLTETNNNSLNQICLVKNPPSKPEVIRELITEFNKNTPFPSGNFKRLFIKEHDYIFFPALTLGENIDYTSKDKTRNDLDNIDFLASSSSYVNNYGKRITSLNINIGELWFYKN